MAVAMLSTVRIMTMSVGQMVCMIVVMIVVVKVPMCVSMRLGRLIHLLLFMHRYHLPNSL